VIFLGFQVNAQEVQVGQEKVVAIKESRTLKKCVSLDLSIGWLASIGGFS